MLLRRIRRSLRSRRLAVSLLLLVAVYSWLATLVPQGGPAVAEVRVWAAAHPTAERLVAAIGFHRAYTAPAFLALIALLTLATALCGWERTARALRTLRSLGAVTDSLVDRLRRAPALPVAPSVADPLAAAERELRDLRLRVRRGPTLLEATGGRTGLLGSPVFHWALALLFVVVALGRLTRSEGMIGVPVGGSRTDEAASYGVLEEGPLHGGHSGLVIAASDLMLDYVSPDGTPRDAAPVVELRDGVRTVASGRVHANAPLRHGTLLIHMNDFGLASWIVLEDPAGRTLQRLQPLADFETGTDTGTTPASLTLTAGSTPVDVTLAPLAEADHSTGERFLLKRVPREPLLRVATSIGGRSREATLGAGEAIELAEGYRLRFEDLTHYVRLSVVDDWSVPIIYALFAVAALGLTLAVFAPFRSVRVLRAEDGGVLRGEVRHVRDDPVFLERAAEALRRAAGVAYDRADPTSTPVEKPIDTPHGAPAPVPTEETA